MIQINDTIIAISTPIGKGAISVIRLSGKDALNICKKFVTLKNLDLSKAETHKLYLANVKDIDEVMFVYMKAPNTYTGEDVIEISCHNNIFILEQILQTAQNCGARLAKPGEFTERAFLNGKLDLTQAEAVIDVVHAESAYSENIAQKQLKGGLAKKVEHFRNQLLDLLKDLEVVLDHEDIMDFNHRDFANKLEKIKLDLTKKIAIGERVNKFCHGLHIALIGRPNVGKSSLLNMILDKEKSIVSEIAGTTRDAVEAIIEHKGIKINLVDTAGLKHQHEFSEDAHSEIERKGIEKTNEYMATADFVFLIVDLLQYDFPQDIKELDNVILVGNKADVKKVDIEKYLQELQGKVNIVSFIEVSAKTDKNIEKLLDLVIDDFLKDCEISESQFVVNARHKAVFDGVLDSIHEAKDLLMKNEALELISIEMRRAVDFLAEILGIDVTEEVLDRIFSEFCVGK